MQEQKKKYVKQKENHGKIKFQIFFFFFLLDRTTITIIKYKKNWDDEKLKD